MAFHQYSNLRPVHYYWFVSLAFCFFIQEIIFLPSVFSNKASNTEVFPSLPPKLYHREATIIYPYRAYIPVGDTEDKHMNEYSILSGGNKCHEKNETAS